MAHFTCVGATREELRATLGEIEAAGVENVLALRGDPPAGETEWKPTEGGLLYSTELIALLAEEFDFAVGAAAFPEVHPEAKSSEADIQFLRAKQDAGARFLITQLFYDNEFYFDFVARAREAGITVPIIPGIMPVTSFRNIKRITELCKSEIPDAFERELKAREDDEDAVQDLGVAYATLQCVDLLARGAPGIHFYTLNRSPATRAILAALRAAQPWTRAALAASGLHDRSRLAVVVRSGACVHTSRRMCSRLRPPARRQLEPPERAGLVARRCPPAPPRWRSRRRSRCAGRAGHGRDPAPPETGQHAVGAAQLALARAHLFSPLTSKDGLWVQFALGGAQCGGKMRRALAVIPGAMVAADGVMVDRPSGSQDRLRGGRLHLVPLLEL